MLNDPLQKRLYEMEQQNPSENQHPISLIKRFLDTLNFSRRYISGSVTHYPDGIRTEEKEAEDEVSKPARAYHKLCRTAATCNPAPFGAEYARQGLLKES